MEELLIFFLKRLFKNSHVYITKYKITDLFFFREEKKIVHRSFINKLVPVGHVDCSRLKNK
jgi:hypothetical protein